MSEHSPEFDTSPIGAVAANDEVYAAPTQEAANDDVYATPSAEIVDINTGDAFTPEVESEIEAALPTTSIEEEKPLLTQYEAALRRFPNTAPTPAEEVPVASALEAEVAPAPTLTPETAPTPVVAAEVAPANKEVPEDILNSYKEKFGINKEDLEGVEGFKDLSRGQQRQVMENLAQLTVGKIREDAIDGHKDDLAEQKKNANFLGKVWIGVKDSFTKKFDVVEREKKLASEIQHGGIEEHKGSLEQMVKGMKELGPAVKEGDDGTLEVQFVETDGMSPELSKIAEVFNEQGTAFSKVPYEWSLDTASPEQQDKFQQAKETYELQRSVLMKHMSDAGGPEMATKAMAQTESIIEMQRFMQTCPDAGEELKSIENQNAWTAALKSVGTERGAYMALGAVTRTAVGAMAGFVAAPAAAALTGAIRGWRKAGDDLRERDALARKGVADESDEAKNMVLAARTKEGDAEVGYRGSSEKIDALVKKLGGSEDSAKSKEQLVISLRQRIDYTKQKISEGKMVFGESGERIANQYSLMRSLAHAEAAIAGETFTDGRGDKLEERLARMLGKTDNEIKDARSDYKFKQAVKAGLTGAAFAGLGAAAADAVKWMNGAPAPVTEYVVDKLGKAKVAVGEAVERASEGVIPGEVLSPEEMMTAMPTPPVEVVPEYTPFVDGSQALILNTPKPDMINGLDLPPDYVFPSMETLTPHVVAPGENLSSIFAREIPGSTNADVVRLLKSMSPAQLKEIGVTSGNPDLIYPGDNINVGRMREMLVGSPSGVASTEGYVDGSQGLIRGSGVGGGGVPPAGTESVAAGATLYENDGTATIVGEKETTVADWYTEPVKPEAAAPLAPPPPPPKFMQADAASIAPKQNVSWEEENTVRVQQEQAAAQIKAAGVAEKLIDPNRPGANPLNYSEATKVFGAEGTGNRDLAEKMLREAGRYPNKAELAVFQQYQSGNPAAAKSLLEHMRTGSVMTENEALKLGKQNYDSEYLNSAKKGLFREDAYKSGPVQIEKPSSGIPAGVESGAVPSRTLSQISDKELAEWPFDKPSPWPVNQAEASDMFGAIGTKNRELAESMKQALGRYPNEEEYLGFRKIKDVDPVASRDMLLAMKKSPQSFAQVRSLTQPSALKTPAPTAVPSRISGLQVNDALRAATAGSSGSVKQISDIVGQQAASGVSFTKGAGAVLSQTATSPALKAVGEFLRKS